MKRSESLHASPNLQYIYPGRGRKEIRGYSLLELLVALAILAIILLLSFQMISGTSGVWIRSNSKAAEGREARVAFNSMIARLSQATVDQYYGYTWSNTSGTLTPVTYIRHSELRFLSGITSGTTTPIITGSTTPTDAVFFVAPLGIVSNTSSYGHLPSLLNICGYYIQWSNSDPLRPAILGPSNGPYHFQLMQFVQPSEQMSLYYSNGPANAGTANNYPTYTPVTTNPAWQTTAMSNSPSGIRPIANNVVALLLLPAKTTTSTYQTPSEIIAPGFLYNSEVLWTSGTAATTAANRLPPVMRVVMYTIDDISAKKLATQYGSTMPPLYAGLFTDPTKLYPNTTTSDIGDLGRFENVLLANKLTFRRFEAAVELPRAPWNTQN